MQLLGEIIIKKMRLIIISFYWLKPKSIVDARLPELLNIVDGRALLLLLLELLRLCGIELFMLCGFELLTLSGGVTLG